MYLPVELARFALSEFERGLAGLTDQEARTRLTKADGTQTNAISWIVGHVARHWLSVRSLATLEPGPTGLRRFASGSTEPAPPPLSDVLKLFQDAKASIDWIIRADDAVLATRREAELTANLRPPQIDLGMHKENVGTALMRAILHTWFHIGEVNAIRQMLGHPEIFFVGRLVGNLEWRS